MTEEEQGITVVEAANRLGQSVQAVYRWMRGPNPRIRRVRPVAAGRRRSPDAAGLVSEADVEKLRRQMIEHHRSRLQALGNGEG